MCPETEGEKRDTSKGGAYCTVAPIFIWLCIVAFIYFITYFMITICIYFTGIFICHYISLNKTAVLRMSKDSLMDVSPAVARTFLLLNLFRPLLHKIITLCIVTKCLKRKSTLLSVVHAFTEL